MIDAKAKENESCPQCNGEEWVKLGLEWIRCFPCQLKNLPDDEEENKKND